MIKSKFVKNLLAVSVSSAIFNSHGVEINDPTYLDSHGVEINDPTYENNDFMYINTYDDRLYFTNQNKEFINKGYINSENRALDFITFDQSTEKTIKNFGTLRGWRILADAKKGHQLMTIDNTGFIDVDLLQLDSIPGKYDGLSQIQNTGKIKTEVFIRHRVPTKYPSNNYGLSLNSNRITFNFTGLLNNAGIMTYVWGIHGSGQGFPDPTFNNLGIVVDTKQNTIEIGDGGEFDVNGTKMEIINGEKTEDQTPNILISKKGGEYTNKILNAKTIIFDGKSPVKINSSIVNAGIDLASKSNPSTEITFTDSIYNGSYDENVKVSIAGDNASSKITFDGKSVINGDLIYDNKNNNIKNELNIASSTILNSNLDGGSDTAKNIISNLNITKASGELKIFHNVKNFENMSVAGNTIVYESANFENVKNIDIQNGADLIVRADMKNKNVSALVNNDGVIKSSGGNLVIDAFPNNPKLNEGDVINFGKTKLDDSLWGIKDGKPTGEVDSHVSAKHGLVNADLFIDPQGNNQIIVTAKKDLPMPPPIAPVPPVTPPVPPVDNGNNGSDQSKPDNSNPSKPADYDEYNEIYQAIKDAGKFGDLSNTSDLEQVYWTLEQIYSANPYGYAMKSNLDSLRLFKEVDYKTVVSREGEDLFTVRAIYTGNRTDNYASGKGHYNEQNLKTKSNTVGALISNEYGLENKSIGFALGYSKQNVKFKGLSSIKNDNFYAGLFLKNRFGQFQTKIGVDYQFTRANVDHNIVNALDSFNNKAKFNNNIVSAYVEGKYSFDITPSFSISPVANVAYYYINQGSIDEGEGRLATKVEKANLNLVDVGAGFDFGYRTYVLGGAIKQVLHLGAVGTFGDNDKTLHGSFTRSATGGANAYRFKAVTIPKVMGKVGYKVEYESVSRFVYGLGGSYEIGKRNQNFDAQIGLGYKF